MIPVPKPLKHLFVFFAIAWMLLWIGSLMAIGGLMGNSIQILSVYLGIAFAPPCLVYFLLFYMGPRIIERLSKTSTHL